MAYSLRPRRQANLPFEPEIAHYKTTIKEINTGGKILKYFKKKTPPTVYSGLAVVVLRKDLKRHFEVFAPKNMDNELAALIATEMDFPQLPDDFSIIDKDSLVLDIAVSEYQLGALWDLSSIKDWLVIFWRPKVQIRSRIYKIENKQTIANFKIIKKMKWIEVFKRIIFLQADMDGAQHTKYLLVCALKELNSRMRKIIL